MAPDNAGEIVRRGREVVSAYLDPSLDPNLQTGLARELGEDLQHQGLFAVAFIAAVAVDEWSVMKDVPVESCLMELRSGLTMIDTATPSDMDKGRAHDECINLVRETLRIEREQFLVDETFYTVGDSQGSLAVGVVAQIAAMAARRAAQIQGLDVLSYMQALALDTERMWPD